MKNRLLKKMLRDVDDYILLRLNSSKKLGKRMAYFVDKEMGLRYETVVSSVVAIHIKPLKRKEEQE